MHGGVKVIYELLGGDVALYVLLLQTAACMKNIGELADATDVYEHGHFMLSRTVSPFLPLFLPPFTPLIQPIIDSRKKRKTGPTGPSGTPTPSTTKDPTTTSLFAKDKFLNTSKAKSGAQDETEVESGAVEGVEGEGAGGCEGMVLVLTSLPRLTNTKSAGVAVFRGVLFDVIGRGCLCRQFILTKRGQRNVAEEILRHIMVANTCQPQDQHNSIRIALIGIILAERPDVVVKQTRKLITTHQFNEPLRILFASLASGQPWGFEVEWAVCGDCGTSGAVWNHKIEDGMRKRMVRHLSQRQREWCDSDGGCGWCTQHSDERDSRDRCDDVQVYIAAKNYQSAMFYLLHAYDYYPDDPLICRWLAIASIGRAMQRQSHSRHHKGWHS
ncbi:hypothetical protein BJ165DRAFT_1409787 [Panaeolus papilionaceus]|nr:hypothetical protein BJ165DRAFT_1409787 [Panaeolus papilionaceus]